MSTHPSQPAPPGASTLVLPRGPWATVHAALCAHFDTIPAGTWAARFAEGRILDAQGVPLDRDARYVEGRVVRYFRAVENETPIPFTETVLHADAHLVVADKPHFLAVVPAGAYVEETLLRRLMARLDNPHLVPLHRIDRLTAGLVLFSTNPATRAAYQAMFAGRTIEKRYEALAPPLPGLSFPLVRRSRLVPAEPFFRMQEAAGEPNAETHVSVLERSPGLWRYGLAPVTGKKHQLRVHMSALGAPIQHDPWYPALSAEAADDFGRPLQLLAKSLRFVDPLDGRERRYETRLQLKRAGNG